ncbi:MAG: hypothetical protein CMC97_01175 [Flavobacteriales bacterium]|nr:hypothetical protein [Flavobacteriales bacterium]
MNSWNSLWKWGGVALLAYVILRGFSTPLQPGFVQASPSRLAPGIATIALDAIGQPFATATDAHEAFTLILRSGEGLIQTELTGLTPHRVEAKVAIPATLPSPALDAFLFTPEAGTLFLGNAFFVEDAANGSLPAEVVAAPPAEQEPQLGFSFPFQPNILESVRNLLWHVPMWFAMFFVMGIGFVASLAQLRTGKVNWDHRAEAAVRTGLVFGLLGLATGSLWARWTWGAWWVSDPQLNGALVTVLLYSGYMVLRAAMVEDERAGRIAAVYNVFAFVMLVILLMVLPRYTESLHPGKDGNPGFNSYDLDNSLRAVFYPAVIGWGALCYWMYTLRLRMNRLEHHLLTR